MIGSFSPKSCSIEILGLLKVGKFDMVSDVRRLFCAVVGLSIGVSTGCDSPTEQAGHSSSGAGGEGAGGEGAGGGHAATASGSGGTSTSGSGGAGGDAGAGGTIGFQDVAFASVEFDLPEWTGTTPEIVLFHDGTAFQRHFGVAAPAAIDWSTDNALFYTEGALPFPGHIASVQTLALRDDDGELRIGTQLRSPGNGCEVLQWAVPAYQLIEFPVLVGSPLLTQEHAPTDFDCTVNGATESNSCDEVNLCGASLAHDTSFEPRAVPAMCAIVGW